MPERYRIIRELGRGAMGVVFLAHDQMLGEEIALKIIHEHLTTDEATQKRFLREISLTRKVTHGNVVRTFEAGTIENQVFLAMEYVPGTSLKELISNRNLTPEEAMELFIEVTKGLSAIHRADIIHRDLKLSNILLSDDGYVKITDFGIARPKSSDLTCEDEMLGTATHMAPEVWKGEEVTKSTDLYALGIIGYELLTSILPFPSSTPMELMYHHIHSKPVSPRTIKEDIPEFFASLILSLLEKDKNKRPLSAIDVISYLENPTPSTTTSSLMSGYEAPQVDLKDTSGLNIAFSSAPAVVTEESPYLKPRISLKPTKKRRRTMNIPWKLLLVTLPLSVVVGGGIIAAWYFVSTTSMKFLGSHFGFLGLLGGAFSIALLFSLAMTFSWFLLGQCWLRSWRLSFKKWITGTLICFIFSSFYIGWCFAMALHRATTPFEQTALLSEAITSSLQMVAYHLAFVPLPNGKTAEWSRDLPISPFAILAPLMSLSLAWVWCQSFMIRKKFLYFSIIAGLIAVHLSVITFSPALARPWITFEIASRLFSLSYASAISGGGWLLTLILLTQIERWRASRQEKTELKNEPNVLAKAQARAHRQEKKSLG